MQDHPAPRALRATLGADGSPGPVEMRIGRRLVGLLQPDSVEAKALLRAGQVELIGPGGETFGRVGLGSVWRTLGARLERRLQSVDSADDDPGVRDGLARLRELEALFG